MRRQFAAALCTVALLLAGCQGIDSEADRTPTATPDSVFTLEAEGNDPTAPTSAANAPPDPETDRLGWERGYWHNETLEITEADGLNESERPAVVARSMARVEEVRGLEFEESVSVEVVSREAFRKNLSNDPSEALRRFDNAKFEMLFLVGEERDSIAVQRGELESSVLGYYSADREAIVLVSDSATPTVNGRTLAHELVHALQDQQFGLENERQTRDRAQGENGLIEGDATTVGGAYAERCGEQWDCLDERDRIGGSDDRHVGISVLQYFPYNDGPGFVAALRDRGGWAAVDDAYGDRPDGAREVSAPEEYPSWEPRDVSVNDRTSGDWERVRPSERPDYGVVGPSAIAAAIAYTAYDEYNESSVVSQQTVRESNRPYNYDLPGTTGWEGGRLHVYTDGTETSYVWRTVWTDDAAAERFADVWTDVLAHWGGRQTADGNWVIADESPFTDAIAVQVEGDTVTVINAPTEAELSEVHDA